jgi:hypothetical protein
MDTNTDANTNTEIKTNPKRPAVVTIAAILLIVLSLFVASLGVANQFGLLGGGFGNGQFVARNGQNRNFNSQGGFPQGGFPQGGAPQGGFQNDPNNPGTTPNRTFNRQSATGLASIFRILRPVTIALDIILLVLSVVAAIGLFKSKRWGTILAIVISVLLILLTVPSMIRIFSTVTLAENLVRILLAVAVIVLLLLPSARKSNATPVADDQVEVERVVR